MAGVGPDLQDSFDYLGGAKKFDGPCNSSNISNMAANFMLQVSHSHVSEAISLNLLDRITMATMALVHQGTLTFV